MEPLITNQHNRFDFIIVDWSVAKFMSVQALEQFIQMLKPTGSIFIQGIISIRHSPKFFVTKTAFETACIEDFALFFSTKTSLIGNIPAHMITKDPNEEDTQTAERDLFNTLLQGHCKDTLNCTFTLITEENMEIFPNVLWKTIHPLFIPRTSSPLYKITRNT